MKIKKQEKSVINLNITIISGYNFTRDLNIARIAEFVYLNKPVLEVYFVLTTL